MKLGLSVVFLASLLAACGGGTVTQMQNVAPTCGPPPPSAAPNASYVAVPLPALSPSTTYSVKYTYTDYNDVPPSCTGPRTQPLGSFMTQ